ncbi:carbonic anhydrase family protein [Mucilaginibacter sp.]|uniref:carbonic anhydrase family protein n=1 Tax=Mucilaginibacter sp. TaxID=1882438 RepID=UPI0025F64E70|nr:carbonic anhydrase family protein [Mucilaginibacter sp.]
MKKLTFIFIATISLSFSSKTSYRAGDAALRSSESVPHSVITAKPLTPDSVINLLKSGNRRFYNFKPLPMNDSARIRLTAKGQKPIGAVLSCLDSRVPVETVFNMGIGDLFVARVAGNIGNEDIWGSLEYATFVVGAKVIVVLGHEDCGAIKSAIDNVKLGNITALLAKIRPAVDAVKIPTNPKERTSKNKKFVRAVMVKNVELTIKKMRKDSPIIDKLVRDGKVKILGGIYDVATGKIAYL